MRAYQSRLIALTIAFFISSGIEASAQSAPTSASKGIDLDLSSTRANLAAPSKIGNQTVSINVGGSKVSVTSSSVLTPAERLAVYQVLTSGHQSIQLGSQGNAIGGTFMIGDHFTQYVNSLNIPQGVTAIKNFGSSNTLNLAGNLTNSGILYAVSNNPAANVANISANNITNTSGALLTSLIPTSGLPGYSNLISNLSLSVTALNKITNQGTISSAAALSVSAGSSINNTSSGVGTASLISQGNLSLYSGNVLNSGLIASRAADINIFSPGDLLIKNTGGVLDAANGNVNIRESTFQGNFRTDVLGGIINANNLNLNAGEGAANVNLLSTSSVLNANACSLHTSVEKGNLRLGTINVSGDPDFYSVNGDVMLSGAIDTHGASLAVVAGGDIRTNPLDPVSINTEGGNLSMVAGAIFTTDSNSNSVSPPATPGSDRITIRGFNDSGNILLRDIYYTNTSSSGNGGNVQLIAPGQVIVGSGIYTQGSPRSGNISIIAGQNQVGSDAVNIAGNINSTSANNGGTVSIINAAPLIANGANNPVVFIDGQQDLSAGSFSAGSLATAGSSVVTGSITTGAGYGRAGDILISSAAGHVQTGNLSAYAYWGSVGDIIISSGSFSSRNITSSAYYSGSGGNVSISASNGSLNTGTVFAMPYFSLRRDSGGHINLSAYSDIHTQELLANSNNGDGGSISLSSSTGNIQVNFIRAYSAGSQSSSVNLVAANTIFVDSIDASGFFGGQINMSAGGAVHSGNISANGSMGAGTVHITGSTLTGTYISAYSTYGPGGTIDLKANTMSYSGVYSRVATLYALGRTEGGSIKIVARDPDLPFTVGALTANGTAGNIIANGPDGSIHISACGGVNVIPPASITALGGTITIDKACCPTLSKISAVTPISTASTVVERQFIPLATPSSAGTDGTIAPTDTLIGNGIAKPAHHFEAGLPATTASSAFIAYDSTGTLKPSADGNQEIASLSPATRSLIGNGISSTGWRATAYGASCAKCGGSGLREIAYNNVENRDDNVLSLTKGAALYHADHPLTVETALASVQIAKGSVVLMLETGDSLAVYNLYDEHRDDVRVNVKRTSIPLAPGQMVNLSELSGSFGKVCQGKGISYRKPALLNTGSNIRAYVADFSMPSALANVPPLQTASKKQGKHSMSKVFKTAAIVTQIRAKEGPFTELGRYNDSQI
jgi:hypothetical protein